MPIFLIITTIMNELPAAIALAAKLKAIFAADGSNLIVQIQTLQQSALLDASETQKEIDKWHLEHPEVPKV